MASASGAMGPSQQAVMEVTKKAIVCIDADALEPITPAELEDGFSSPPLRLQFLNGGLVVALAGGVPSP
jgi:hypothetical protein